MEPFKLDTMTLAKQIATKLTERGIANAPGTEFEAHVAVGANDGSVNSLYVVRAIVHSAPPGLTTASFPVWALIHESSEKHGGNQTPTSNSVLGLQTPEYTVRSQRVIDVCVGNWHNW